jgi:site-specific DNA recombinase
MTRVAIYTRFSSDKQSVASTEDQRRLCERKAVDAGWEVVAHFADEALSGSLSVADRPGATAMQDAALAGAFEVLVIESLDRLSRDMGELDRVVKRLEFRRIRIIGVSDGYDSAGKSRGLLRAIRGGLSEQFLTDLAAKTHRGIEGHARKGNNTGGRAYGYKHVPIEDPNNHDTAGRPIIIAMRREIDPDQAEVVRRIFQWYAEGMSSCGIASRLNADGVPPPRASWARKGPTKGWCASTITGRTPPQNGMLTNALYIGRTAWNRTTWVTDPDTGKQKRIDRPRSEWIQADRPELRIVDQVVWDRVQQRRADHAQAVAARIRTGIAAPAYRGAGAPGKYLFSGLLICAECGGRYIVANPTHYACGSVRDGKTHLCSNRLRVKKTLVEAKLLEGVQRKLLAPEVEERVAAEFRERMAIAARAPKVDKARIATLRAEIERLVDAVATGALAPSPTVRERQQRAEAELARLESDAAVPVAKVTRMVPKVAESYRELVADLPNVLLHDVARARVELRRLLGSEIRLHPSEDRTYLNAELPDVGDRLVQLAVANALNFKERTIASSSSR